jgi:hypothetical protein
MCLAFFTAISDISTPKIESTKGAIFISKLPSPEPKLSI